jgi:hypothetical protein
MALKPVAVTLLWTAAIAHAVIVDRVAITMGTSIIKDSDILEDLQITAFLNNESPATSLAARKVAASRLIDQAVIRKEIDSGAYPSASAAETQTLLAEVEKRYPNETAFKRALTSHGIEEDDLKDHLVWQLTVLHFIDARFRPSALITDEDIEKYYNEHKAQLEAANAGKPATLEALHAQIQDLLTGERVNQLLDDWLTRRRQNAKIVYLEDALK